MNRIFCLETEWDQTMHDLKKKSTVLPLLDFLENTINIEYTFRQVATESDFNYYIDHLQQPSYSAYDLIYLCFHGQKKCICFADKTDLDLMAFAEKKENFGIFVLTKVPLYLLCLCLVFWMLPLVILHDKTLEEQVRVCV